MVKRRGLSRILRVAAGVAALLLVVWLALAVLGRTELRVDLEGREASAEMTLGNLRCRKELKAAFPFFALKCQDARERLPRESSSAPP